MQVQARSMEMLAVDHLFENAQSLNKSCKKRIRQLITHELMRRENPDLPPLGKTHHATYYKANLSLHDAAEKGDLDRLKYIVERKGVSLDLKRFGKTALIDALRAKQMETALYLIENGANVNAADKEGYTPLHLAVMSNNRMVVAKLLEKNANVAAVDKAGRTALYHATEIHGNKMIKLLLKHHFIYEANIAALDGSTPLHAALNRQNYEAAEALINWRTKVDLVDNQGRTALHCAVLEHYESLVMKLLERGADPTLKTLDGETALHYCCYSSYSSISTLNELCRRKRAILINAKNSDGLTALHIAIKRHNDPAIRWLMEHDADLTVLDKQGTDLRTYIITHGNRKTLEYFDDYHEKMKSYQENRYSMFF